VEQRAEQTKTAGAEVVDFLATLHPALIDGIQGGFGIIDRDFRIQASNRYLQEWTKHKAEEMRGRHCYWIFHQRDSVCPDCPSARTFDTGETATAMHTGLDGEGGTTYAEITTHPIKDRSGQVLYVIEYIKDVSERKRFEERTSELLHALTESEEKYRTMVELSNDLIWTLDASGKFVWFNPRAEEISGHRLADWVGHSFVPLILPEELPRVQEIFADTLEGQRQSYEVNIFKKSGELLTLLVNTTPMVSEGKVKGTVSFATDITDRKQAEVQLRRRNNELEVLNAIGAAVSRSLDLNEILEGALDSVLQVMDLCPKGGIFLLDEDRKELQLTVTRGLDKEFLRKERRVKLGECLCGQAAEFGQIIYSPDSLLDGRHSRVYDPEPHAHVVVPLSAHGKVQGVLFLYLPSGYVFSPLDERLFMMIGRQVGIAIENARLYQETDEQLQRKVTELKAALELAEQEHSRAREALQLREEFLSVASHELKTPMTSLRGFVQLATRQLNRSDGFDPERIKQGLRVIDMQSEKLSRLISQLLDISRIEAGQLALEREMTDVASLVKAVVAHVQPASPRHSLVVDAAPGTNGLVDPLRLEQVITNLIDNAVKYSPDGGQIRVSVSAAESALQIAVTDRGLGVSPEHRDRIFDRFYQAHGGGHFGGLGLGLYISREIVELHGGRIELDVPDGGGSRFTVLLPDCVVNDRTVSRCAGAEVAGRVLVVDDDEAIVRLVSMALSEEGYEVMNASHGLAALEVLDRWRPDLILLDLRMPLMDGQEFVRAYRQTRGPHSPVILVTAAHDTARPMAEIEVHGCLRKPFDLEELLDVVGQHARRQVGTGIG